MASTDLDESLLTVGAARAWPALMFVAVVSIALGVIVLVWPSETLVVLSVLLGIQFVLFGLFRLISAFTGDTNAPGLVGMVGVLLMVSGVIVLRHPYETVAALATIVGVVWIVGGAVDAIHSMTHHVEGRFWRILGGLFSVAAGVVVVAWPAPTVTVIAWIAGLQLIIVGIFLAATAISMRHAVG